MSSKTKSTLVNEKASLPTDEKILAPSNDKMLAPVTDEKILSPVNDKISLPVFTDDKIAVSSEIDGSVWRKYEVLKSSNAGLIMPENLQLALHQVHPPSIAVEPCFLTSEMNWTDVLTVLPPWFDLTFLPNPNNPTIVKRAASIQPQGMQGVTGVTVNIEFTEPNSDPLQPSRWTIKRSSLLSRSYRMKPVDSSNNLKLAWTGLTKSKDVLKDDSPNCNGNLKLVAEHDGKVLAVWKQRRDMRLLGTINIFEGAPQVLPVEGIIASCLCCVMCERVSGMNWIGGLGRR